MEKFIDHCCEKCIHSPQSPCSIFVACCLEGPLCHEDGSCKNKRESIVKRVALDEDFVVC